MVASDHRHSYRKVLGSFRNILGAVPGQIRLFLHLIYMDWLLIIVLLGDVIFPNVTIGCLLIYVTANFQYRKYYWLLIYLHLMHDWLDTVVSGHVCLFKFFFQCDVYSLIFLPRLIGYLMFSRSRHSMFCL